jgi:PAS domain S-box-containing protein
MATLEPLVTQHLADMQRTIAEREVAGRPPERLDAGDALMERIRNQVQVMNDAERVLLEQRIRASGRDYWIAVGAAAMTAFLGMTLTLTAAWLFRRDQRNRETAHAQLYEQKEWFSTTLASIGDAVMVTDPAAKVVFMNEMAQSLTGWSMAQAGGHPMAEVFEIVNESTRAPAVNPVDRVIATGLVQGLANHTVLLARDGREYPIDDSAAPIRGLDGQLRGVVIVFRDITERKRAEDALQRADRSKDEFLAMLAHELRNPLAPIRTATEILRRLGAADPVMQKAREIIDRQVQHMARLVDDLLDISRITRGIITLHMQVLDVRRVLAHAVESARPLIDGRQQALEVRLPEEPLLVKGDNVRLTQVFTNLLNNATKYTQEGGRIELIARRDGGSLVISVRDNGTGIAAELLPHVFDVFAQGSRTIDRAQGGLGIGLTVVRRLLSMHGGTVEVASAGAGQGAEFTVTLPGASGTGEPVPSGGGPVGGILVARRILLVDDNVDFAESLALALQLDGHSTRIAHDGSAALLAAPEFMPEVVLLDVGLPQLDGYQVVRRLREQPQTRNAVIIALTGYGDAEHRRRTREAGFDHHLLKPVEPAVLNGLLRSLP